MNYHKVFFSPSSDGLNSIVHVATILAKNSRDRTQNSIVSEQFYSAYLKPVS